ncbi:hypothetical protein DFH06DRAFT_1154996 [Mycena polygramma]|nr:hypothetical protein DFH06DRAFT_1154996 [Mycena polygramma]
MLSFLSLLLLPVALAHNFSIAGRDALQARGGDRFSNYDASDGIGACGDHHEDSEFVVALTQLQWDGGSHCNKQVYITYNGMSAVATIVDECMGCPYNGLDFSQSLFGHFVGGEQNNEVVGYIYGDWTYGTGPSSGDDSTTTTTKKPAPTTTSTKTSTTSTTHTTTSTTSSTHTTTSSTPTPSPSSSASSASASAKSASSASPSSASASAAPTAGASTDGNLHDFTQAILNLAGLVVQAPHAA